MFVNRDVGVNCVPKRPCGSITLVNRDVGVNCVPKRPCVPITFVNRDVGVNGMSVKHAHHTFDSVYA